MAATPLERNGYAYAASIIHGFRMPLFFLISGFFSALLWQARGPRASGERHRLERIGLPLLASLFTVVPAVAWLSAGGDFAPADWLLAWADNLYHLWFLWHLLLLLAGLIVAARLGLEFRQPGVVAARPLSIVPHHFMQEIVFGADTDVDLLPRRPRAPLLRRILRVRGIPAINGGSRCGGGGPPRCCPRSS